jgi:predicted acetyltransferase
MILMMTGADPNTIPMLEELPDPPQTLRTPGVTLRFDSLHPGDQSRGMAPWYHYLIHTPQAALAGHINFRVGDSPHLRLNAGHIGYVVAPAYRGRGLAHQACLAIAPFIRTIYGNVIVTCNPSNTASRRVIERLGAEFLDEGPVPDDDPLCPPEGLIKRRYRWTP